MIAFVGLFTDLKSSGWDNEILEGIDFIEHGVLQIPFFLMSFFRYISPSLDNMSVSFTSHWKLLTDN